jgi:hypothetical protein
MYLVLGGGDPERRRTNISVLTLVDLRLATLDESAMGWRGEGGDAMISDGEGGDAMGWDGVGFDGMGADGTDY